MNIKRTSRAKPCAVKLVRIFFRGKYKYKLSYVNTRKRSQRTILMIMNT